MLDCGVVNVNTTSSFAHAPELNTKAPKKVRRKKILSLILLFIFQPPLSVKVLKGYLPAYLTASWQD
jgi:hypothetical protein